MLDVTLNVFKVSSKVQLTILEFCTQLGHIKPVFYIYSPRKLRKTIGFPTFSGGTEMEHIKMITVNSMYTLVAFG